MIRSYKLPRNTYVWESSLPLDFFSFNTHVLASIHKIQYLNDQFIFSTKGIVKSATVSSNSSNRTLQTNGESFTLLWWNFGSVTLERFWAWTICLRSYHSVSMRSKDSKTLILFLLSHSVVHNCAWASNCRLMTWDSASVHSVEFMFPSVVTRCPCPTTSHSHHHGGSVIPKGTMLIWKVMNLHSYYFWWF